MTFYIAVTPDEYELPVAVAESASELARMMGTSVNAINSWLSKSKRRHVKRPRYEKVEVEGMDPYNLTVYTYDPKRQVHETEDLYFATETPMRRKIQQLKKRRGVCFVDVYQWNDEDDCYDFVDRIERAKSRGEIRRDDIIGRLKTLRAFCDVASLDDTDAGELFAEDVDALDEAIDLLTELGGVSI